MFQKEIEGNLEGESSILSNVTLSFFSVTPSTDILTTVFIKQILIELVTRKRVCLYMYMSIVKSPAFVCDGTYALANFVVLSV